VYKNLREGGQSPASDSGGEELRGGPENKGWEGKKLEKPGVGGKRVKD